MGAAAGVVAGDDRTVGHQPHALDTVLVADTPVDVAGIHAHVRREGGLGPEMVTGADHALQRRRVERVHTVEGEAGVFPAQRTRAHEAVAEARFERPFRAQAVADPERGGLVDVGIVAFAADQLLDAQLGAHAPAIGKVSGQNRAGQQQQHQGCAGADPLHLIPSCTAGAARSSIWRLRAWMCLYP